MAGAGRQLEAAGQAQQEAVGKLAAVVRRRGGAVPGRVAAARMAAAPAALDARREDASRLRGEGAGDLALFAWQAVARRPLGELRRAVDDPGGALLRGDYTDLAALELRALGLRTVPRRARRSQA